MNVSYINPFIESLSTVFQTMLGLQPTREKPRVPTANPPPEPEKQLTSMIGISGAASGLVALRFPMDTALKLAGKFLGGEYREANNEVIDAISELVNMVAGSAKAKFRIEPAPQLGLPSVVEGSGYRVRYPAKADLIEVPFSSDAGNFTMELIFSQEAAK